MDRTWIYRNIHLIISLLLIRTSEISSKEYYCTKAGTWGEAMTSCTESSGLPLSYHDVYNSTEFILKDNRTVWTADFIYLEYMTGYIRSDCARSELVTDENSRGKRYFWEQCRPRNAYIAQGKTTEGYECGYKTFGYSRIDRTLYQYCPRYDTQYGPCTVSKPYVCLSPKFHYIEEEASTWDKAYSDCSSQESYALWGGTNFTFDLRVKNFEIWIRRVRRVTKGIVNGTITIGGNNIETCGTNVEEVKRYKHNCEELLESVCVFDDTVQDTENLTRDCFEEQTTEVPVNVTRRAFGGSTNVTSADKRTSKEDKDQTTEVSVNVTRWPFVGSTIVTSADAYDNKTSNEHEGQAGDSIAIVVATIIVSLTICCILIGIGLYCYWKQRRQQIDEHNTTVRYVKENLSATSTGRNPSDNGSVNDRANAVDIGDESYEALAISSGINTADHIYTELNREYLNVYKIGI